MDQQGPGGKYFVGWREDGRKASRSFATEDEALTFKWSVEQPDPFAVGGVGLAELQYAEEQPEYVVGGLRGPMVVEPERTLAGYIRQMIDSDRDLRDTTRSLYLRNLRLHIADTTSVGPTSARSRRAISGRGGPSDAGIGARRNVQQLISKAFSRGVLVGDLEVNPLKRAPEVRRPSKQRQDEVEPLTVSQLEALAEAARAPRRESSPR